MRYLIICPDGLVRNTPRLTAAGAHFGARLSTEIGCSAPERLAALFRPCPGGDHRAHPATTRPPRLDFMRDEDD
jgi:hypothetical protein